MIYSNNRTKLSYDPQYTALVEAYYNVVDNDYQLFSESEVLTEAFDAKKIKDRLVKGVQTLMANFGKLINKLIESVKKFAKQIKSLYHQGKYANLERKINKAFAGTNKTVTINAPEIFLYDSQPIDDAFYKINRLISNSYISATFTYEIFDVDFSKDTIDDKIKDDRDIFNNGFNEWAADLKECENYDTDKLFFKDTKSKNYKVDADYAFKIFKNLFDQDSIASNIDKKYKSTEKSMNDFCNNQIEDMDRLIKKDRGYNGTKEQIDEYNNRLSSEFASWALETTKKGCTILSNFNTKVLASYKKYLDASEDILKKILKAAKINPNSKEDVEESLSHKNWDLLDRQIINNDIDGIGTCLALTPIIYRENWPKEMEYYIKYVESKGINPIQKLNPSIGPLIYGSKPDNKLTEHDAAMANAYLQDNFCKERIEDMYKIDNAVQKNKK